MLKNSMVAALCLLLVVLALPSANGQNTGRREGLYTPPDTTGLERWRGNGVRKDDDPFDDDYASAQDSKASTLGPTAGGKPLPAKPVNGWIIGRSERYILAQIALLALLCAVASAIYFWRRFSNRLAPAELAAEIVRENPSSRRIERPSDNTGSQRKAA